MRLRRRVFNLLVVLSFGLLVGAAWLSTDSYATERRLSRTSSNAKGATRWLAVSEDCVVVLAMFTSDAPASPRAAHRWTLLGIPFDSRNVGRHNRVYDSLGGWGSSSSGGFRLVATRKSWQVAGVIGTARGIHVAHYWLVGAPDWFLAVLGALLPVIWYGRKARSRVSQWLCRQCGYDLRGSPACCPECGLDPAV